jgi:hypothetical protein
MTKEERKPFILASTLRKAAANIFFLSIFVGTAPSAAQAQDWIIGGAQAAINPAPEKPVVPENFSFSIPPQSLETALDAYSTATGIQLFYNSRLTAGQSSRGVSGVFSPHAALRVLLTGTSLAPLETAPGAITLALSMQKGLVLTSMPAPLKAPVLPLGILRVEAPPPGDYRLYAATVQYAIQYALQQDPDTRERSYRTALNVWMSSSGSVQHSEVQASTGDQVLDGAITHIVHGIVLHQAPPSDLPQPVHVRIMTGGQP